MTGLERLPTESGVLDITTGEVVAYTDYDGLAAWKRNVKQLRSDLREAEGAVDAALVDAMDANALWTMHAAGVTLTTLSPGDDEQWDAEGLRDTLDALVVDGIITPAARDAAVRIETSYQVLVRGVNALRKIPTLAGLIDRHVTRVPRVRRSVRIK